VDAAYGVIMLRNHVLKPKYIHFARNSFRYYYSSGHMTDIFSITQRPVPSISDSVVGKEKNKRTDILFPSFLPLSIQDSTRTVLYIQAFLMGCRSNSHHTCTQRCAQDPETAPGCIPLHINRAIASCNQGSERMGIREMRGSPGKKKIIPVFLFFHRNFCCAVQYSTCCPAHPSFPLACFVLPAAQVLRVCCSTVGVCSSLIT